MSDVDNEQVLIQGCGVINNSDVHFGEIIVPESVSVVNSLPSVKIDPAKLEHLTPTQRTEYYNCSTSTRIASSTDPVSTTASNTVSRSHRSSRPSR